MKVTFSHAVVLKRALELGFRNIAVLEDDVAFLPRQYSSDIDQQFSRLLSSNSWSIIRLGFRAYFLENNAIHPCPRICRCSFDVSVGDHFCELRKAGCDLRSSDSYILNSRHFTHLLRELLDLRQANSKRIIDVYPMRAYENQWIMLPQVSFQRHLDIPLDYQLGLSALYTSKCAGPRPLGKNTSLQQFDIFI
jgi:GR25 family glycosyltransferase involved in LPS biosynthesis